MIEEDYEAYDPTDWGCGDYPKLDNVSAESRSGQVDWDDPVQRRNYGEPLHYDFDISQTTRSVSLSVFSRVDIHKCKQSICSGGSDSRGLWSILNDCLHKICALMQKIVTAI
jgi:hypothetical protein